MFKIKTDSEDYHVDVYRVGWYGGAGARHVARLLPAVALPQLQPECARDGDTLLYDCAAWDVSVRWAVPRDAVSGVYLARLVRNDGEVSWRADNSQVGWEDQILKRSLLSLVPVQYPADARFSFPDDSPGQLPNPPQPWPHAYGAQGHGRLRTSLRSPRASLVYFVVRDDHSEAEVLFQTSDTTWQAYNLYGGANTYYGLSPPYRRAYKVAWTSRFNYFRHSIQGVVQPAVADPRHPRYQHPVRGGVSPDQVAGVPRLHGHLPVRHRHAQVDWQCRLKQKKHLLIQERSVNVDSSQTVPLCGP